MQAVESRYRRGLGQLTLGLLLLLGASYAQAQDLEFSYSSPRRCVLQNIQVTGVQQLDPSLLIAVSELHTGDTIDVPGPAITNAVKKLNSQNLFSAVSVVPTHLEGDHLTLEIRLQEQPRISSIEYQGAKRSQRKDLEEKVELKVGHQATSATLDAAMRTIRHYYLDKGYKNVKVSVRKELDTAIRQTVRVIFDIDRGKKVKIKKIDFFGNDSFKDRILRWKGFKDTKRINWNFFNSKKFVESKYRGDLKHLIEFYNKHGYRDAMVTQDTVYDISPKRVGISVWLKEGAQYHIRRIQWVGNTVYTAEQLDALLGMKAGDIYDQALLEKRLFTDENSVSTLYMDEGYLFFNVQPVEVAVANDSVSLEMRIMEGPRATVSKVTILGNNRTNEHVIRRELRTKPGELFSKTKIMRSLRELANLGYFNPETLNINPIPNVADGTVELQYLVEEKSSDQFELSAGWGAGMFVGTLGVRFSNFSVQSMFKKEAWRPIPSGDGQSLSLHFTTNGKQYMAFNFAFTEPWLGGRKPTNLTLSAMYSKYDYSHYVWSPSDDYFQIVGASVGIGTRLEWPDDFFTIYGELAYQNYTLRNWKQDFIFTDGQANNLSLKLVWARNSVDQPIYPRSGSNFSLSLQVTPPYSYLSKTDFANPALPMQDRYRWIEYHKWTARAQWYTQLVGDLVLYLNAQLGYLGIWNPKVGYSPFEGFDMGGDGLTGYNYIYGRETIGLRGYANSSITPRTSSGARMANVYDKFTMELRYPVVLKPQTSIYLLLFAEGGNAWYEFNQFNPFELHRSVGAGVRIFLPMLGMLGFDIGYGFDPVVGQPQAAGWQPHFIIGMPM